MDESSQRLTLEQFRARRYLPSLDALRAISVLLVMTCHVHFGAWAWIGGEKGVTVFFILSGYLITSLALSEERERGNLNLSAFYIRRTFRIFPLYYFVLAIYVLAILVLHARPDKYANFVAALPYDLLYVQEYPFLYGVNGEHDNIAFYQSWSLGIEEKFYLVWPLVIFVLLRSRKALRLPVCGVLAVACAMAPFVLGRPAGSMIFQYFNILCGCGLALALDDPDTYESVRALASMPVFLLLTAVLLVSQFTWPIFKIFPYDYPVDVSYAVVATLFVGAVLLNGPRVDRVLARPALVGIGKLSYGIYLVHVLCLNAVEVGIKKMPWHIPEQLLPMLNMLAVVGVATGVAWILSKVVEKPLINLGRRLSQRALQRAHVKKSYALMSPRTPA